MSAADTLLALLEDFRRQHAPRCRAIRVVVEPKPKADRFAVTAFVGRHLASFGIGTTVEEALADAVVYLRLVLRSRASLSCRRHDTNATERPS